MKEFMDKLRERFSQAEIIELHRELDSRIRAGHDQWGPCCSNCPQMGAMIKGCGLWCLPRFKGGLR